MKRIKMLRVNCGMQISQRKRWHISNTKQHRCRIKDYNQTFSKTEELIIKPQRTFTERDVRPETSLERLRYFHWGVNYWRSWEKILGRLKLRELDKRYSRDLLPRVLFFGVGLQFAVAAHDEHCHGEKHRIDLKEKNDQIHWKPDGQLPQCSKKWRSWGCRNHKKLD